MKCYSKTDWILAAVATLIVFIIGACNLTTGVPDWGDDSAAYISEGISIAEGTFQQQIEMNYYYHPSNLPEEAVASGSLVYVWGYPLILSFVFRLVGFGFNSLIWYKIPLLLSLSLSAGVLVLFLRRRFSLIASFTASILFCMNWDLLTSLNKLYADLPFLLFSVLSFLLMECFFERMKEGKQNSLLVIAYGITLWMAYETRLSGFTVCAAAFLGHAIAFVIQTKEKRQPLRPHLLPYLVFCALVLVSERIWLMPATPNLSDLNKGTFGLYFQYYCRLLYRYFASLLFGVSVGSLGYTLILLFLLGVVKAGFQKKNLHLTIFLFGTLVVILQLPYAQGLRYFYNVLPFVVMYVLYGLAQIVGWVQKLWLQLAATKMGSLIQGITTKHGPHIQHRILILFAACMIIASCVIPTKKALINIAHWGEKGKTDMFSAEAIEVYQYIQDNIPMESAIAFGKPRALYLATNHRCFRYDVNGHELSEADYYLLYKIGWKYYTDPDMEMEILLDNSVFTLYRIID